jgi:plastocyanin
MRSLLSTSKTTRAGVLLVIVAAVTSACGGGGGATLEARTTEFAFAPTTWTAPAGEEVTIELINDGTVEHNWSLVKAGSEIASEGELPEDASARADLYIAQGTVGVGESSTVTFTAPPAGEYQVICDIQAHFSAGMRGTLTVEG